MTDARSPASVNPLVEKMVEAFWGAAPVELTGGRTWAQALAQAVEEDKPFVGWLFTSMAAALRASIKPVEGGNFDADEYLIWSNEHRLWWRANSAGYTRTVESAGRYSRSEALKICSDGWLVAEPPPEIPVRIEDARLCLLEGEI